MSRTIRRGNGATRWDMAGQAQRGSRGQGRSPRPGSSPSPARTVTETGTGAGFTTATSSRVLTQAAEIETPATRTVYRLLQTKGLTPGEAASLTAFMCGLPITDMRWTLQQLNQLLFLRRLRQIGRFDGSVGGHRRVH